MLGWLAIHGAAALDFGAVWTLRSAGKIYLLRWYFMSFYTEQIKN